MIRSILATEFIERIVTYMDKATNEAKVHTSWVTANNEYDKAIHHFIRSILSDSDFIQNFHSFQQRTAYYGVFNSLAQTMLKFTSSGVPDTYQGCEVWNFSLVDPDNRRSVDYPMLHQALNTLVRDSEADRPALVSGLMENPQDSLIKLYLSHTVLNYRRQHETLFRDGDYLPLAVQGNRSRHVCAFRRTEPDNATIVGVPVLVVALTDSAQRSPVSGGVWQDTRLLLGDSVRQQYRSIFTGEVLAVRDQYEQPGLSMADVLNGFPVALLERL